MHYRSTQFCYHSYIVIGWFLFYDLFISGVIFVSKYWNIVLLLFATMPDDLINEILNDGIVNFLYEKKYEIKNKRPCPFYHKYI
jgi:hypothetical protein